LGYVSLLIERLFSNDKTTSFYTNWQSVNTGRASSWFTHEKYDLPVVPSFPAIPTTKEEMEYVVDKLGNFPIIAKAVGGSLGVGVMRIDSMKSLQSVLDYFRANNINVILRKYIEHDYYVRAVVVGGDVVASHLAYTMDGEFRTNAGDDSNQKREVAELSEDVKRDVVKAVQVLGLETGGVDLLFDKNGRYFIAEVNFPNNFSVTQEVTGVDIAEEMLKYLLEKADGKNADA
jgi:RimK family alpha-L-glutamate ligase